MRTAILKKDGELEFRITYFESEDGFNKLKSSVISRLTTQHHSYRGTEAEVELQKWKKRLRHPKEDEEVIVNEFEDCPQVKN